MTDRALYWRELVLPPVVSPAAAQAVLLGLAALPGQPRLVLEALATGGGVSWRVGSDMTTLHKAVQIVRTYLPEAQVRTHREAKADTDNLTVAGQLRISRSRSLPLASADAQVDSTARGLLAVFASTGRSELVRMQVVLGPRLRPRRAPEIEGVTRTVLASKSSQHGFGCCLRLAARSGHEARARQLVSSAASALRGLETPGVSMRLQRVSPRAIVDTRSPLLWPLWLSIDDLIPLLGWPISSEPRADLPAVPNRHPRLMPPTKQHVQKSKGGRVLASATANLRSGTDSLITQAVPDALQHTHVMGLTGTGKSTLLAQMALSDAAAGRGAVVIDPKGDLVDDLLARIPSHRLADIVVLDARDDRPIGINPLVGKDPDLAADGVLAVFHSLYASSWGPRTHDILHACLLTLARRGDASLVMVPLLLTNPGFRRSVVGQAVKADPLGLGSFWSWFDAISDAERAQAIAPLMNKLRQVLMRPALRGIFGQRRPRFDMSDIFTGQKILLVALGKGSIGSEAAQLLGSLVVSQLWQTITQRIEIPAAQRSPVMVYVDEVQDYLRLPVDLDDALAQARGFGVGFTLAHQELGQLGPIKSAVMANARSRIFFQIAPDDASQIANAFGDGALVREDFRALPAFRAYAQLLSSGSTAPWVSLSTRPLPKALRSPQTLRARSADRYGQPLDEVETDLLSLLGHDANPNAAATLADRTDLGRRRPNTDHKSPNQPKGGTS